MTFSKPMNLGDFTSLPAKLELTNNPLEALVTVMEGKFHQVKRMVAHCGKEVSFLKRLSMGPLTLDETLKPGEFRELTIAEIEKVKQIQLHSIYFYFDKSCFERV